MKPNIKHVFDFNKALAHGPYVWPGGYPYFGLCADGESLSFKTLQEEAGLIRNAIIAGPNTGNDQWRVVHIDVNWEDKDLYCAHSNERIPAAYENDEEQEP